jgi:hypothetical protein
MRQRNLTVARRQLYSANIHESAGLFNLAVSLYQMAKNRLKMAGGEQGRISDIDGKISHCQSMAIDDEDDN